MSLSRLASEGLARDGSRVTPISVLYNVDGLRILLIAGALDAASLLAVVPGMSGVCAEAVRLCGFKKAAEEKPQKEV